MLVSNSTIIIWNSRNKKHYESIGYKFTKMGDSFLVSVQDLTRGCNSFVNVKCDYCGKEFQIRWDVYVRIKEKTLVNKDACKDCGQIKADESIVDKYGSHSEAFFASNIKRVHTNMSRYGAECVFAAEEIKQKIVCTNLFRYGVQYSQQSRKIREKTVATCMSRYGVSNYVELFKGKFIKENSPVWKGGTKYNGIERATYEYVQWRKSVFQRDHYTCQKCGAKSKKGNAVTLNAHHILNWADNAPVRYDVENGITLCKDCHTLFHSKYGKRETTFEQLKLFLNENIDEKIC